jgi:hypothetical protein
MARFNGGTRESGSGGLISFSPGLRRGLCSLRMADELPSRVIASIAFVGRSGGAVKTLGGFKKGRHTLPDAANAVTTAFLGRICAGELTEDAERLFQAVRAGLGYKRKDIALSVTAPLATLTARDFTVDMVYSLDENEAARYAVTTTLRELREVGFMRRENFAQLFPGAFSEICFALMKGARVEAVIDAIEALEGEGGLSVDYPSDYRDCTIRVEGVDADVRCTGGSLEVVFSRGGAPAELIDGFVSVRQAFQISKALSGLMQ